MNIQKYTRDDEGTLFKLLSTEGDEWQEYLTEDGVCDLLVDKHFRGKGIGKQLMECIYEKYPSHTVFVLSGVDDYYYKLGYKKEGSIFVVKG